MTTEYRVLTYRDQDDKPVAGILIDEVVYPAKLLAGNVDGIDSSSVLGLLQKLGPGQPYPSGGDQQL